VRIVSLLPSATEIAFAVGAGPDVAGVTFECDHPAGARGLPVVSGTTLATDGSLTAAELDAAVSAKVAAGESIYTLDADRIRAIDPDLILTQDLCQVCAVPTGAVEDALATLGGRAEVVSLDPSQLDEVIADVGRVGAATGREQAAESVMTELRRRVAAVERAVAGRPRRRVLLLEWGDPPFNAGHWMPDMIVAAGGEAVLGEAGSPSRRLAWDEVAAADVDVVVFAPCGFDTARAATDGAELLGRPELAGADVWAVHADAYFSRPGPRLIDGTELLAAIIHPDAVDSPPDPVRAVRLR
jgi:iron complex transport system substrate-binding protein